METIAKQINEIDPDWVCVTTPMHFLPNEYVDKSFGSGELPIGKRAQTTIEEMHEKMFKIDTARMHIRRTFCVLARMNCGTARTIRIELVFPDNASECHCCGRHREARNDTSGKMKAKEVCIPSGEADLRCKCMCRKTYRNTLRAIGGTDGWFVMYKHSPTLDFEARTCCPFEPCPSAKIIKNVCEK